MAMSITEIIIRATGLLILIIGFSTILPLVGITLIGSVVVGNVILQIVVGLVLVAVGIVLLRGGRLTL